LANPKTIVGQSDGVGAGTCHDHGWPIISTSGAARPTGIPSAVFPASTIFSSVAPSGALPSV